MMSTELTPSSEAARFGRSDWRNVAIIAGAMIAVLVLIPPAHEYPIIDDWIYARAVQDTVQTGAFHMPPMSQANLVGQVVWGALWVKLFGFSFTVLTASTLVLAFAALAAFYGLARRLGVRPGGALLAAALLGFNPLFLHLSYSFMTDVPFLALLLGACYCYVRAGQGGHWGWALAGGLLSGGAFLIRQFGVLVPLVFGAYWLLTGLTTRRWPARTLLLTALVPGLILGAWWVTLGHDTPITQTTAAAASRAAAFVFKEPWLRVFTLRATAILPLTALFAWGAVRLPRTRWWLVGVIAAWLLGAAWLTDLPTETWLSVLDPPFTARLGPWAYELPQEPFAFAGEGNILRVDGIDFFQYTQERIWSPEAWRALWMFGGGLAVVLLAGMVAALWDWARGLRGQGGAALTPITAIYTLGLGIFVASLAFPGDLFDRYVLGFTPFVILFVVRGAARWSRPAWVYSLFALGLLALFSLLAKADQMDHARARWEAATWLQARSGAVHMGFDWDNWVGGGNGLYQVADVLSDGFRTELAVPYTSRLSGWTTRTVLAQARTDTPPLPTLPSPR